MGFEKDAWFWWNAVFAFFHCHGACCVCWITWWNCLTGFCNRTCFSLRCMCFSSILVLLITVLLFIFPFVLGYCYIILLLLLLFCILSISVFKFCSPKSLCVWMLNFTQLVAWFISFVSVLFLFLITLWFTSKLSERANAPSFLV